MNKYYVYLHRRMSDGQVFYVGKGKGKRAYSTSGRNKRWLNTYNKHGFVVEIVASDLTESDAFSIEKDVISKMRELYPSTMCNMTDGGEGMSGCKQSEYTISKRALKNTGKIRTEEQKLNISKSLTGRKLSESHLDKIRLNNSRKIGVKQKIESVIKRSIANTGKKRDEAARMNMSNAAKKMAERLNLSDKMRGLGNNSADLTIYTFINIKSGELFKGTRIEMCEKYDIKRSTLSNLFNNNRKTAAGGWSLLKEHNDDTNQTEGET